MNRLLILAGLLAAFVSPAAAQDAACASLSDVTGLLDEQGTKYVMLPDEEVQGFVDDVAEPIVGGEFDGVTNVLIADLSGQIVFGLEIGGCLLGPVAVPGVTTLPAQMSGKMPDGSVHA